MAGSELWMLEDRVRYRGCGINVGSFRKGRRTLGISGQGQHRESD